MAVHEPNTHLLVTFSGTAATPEAIWRLISDFRASMVVWQCDVLAYPQNPAGTPIRTMTFGSFPPVSEAQVVCDPSSRILQYDGRDAETKEPTGYQSQMTVGEADGKCTVDWRAHSIGENGAADNVAFYTEAAKNIARHFGAGVSVETLNPT